MTEPGDEIAAGARGRGRLRASHADRERVIEVLKTAFVEERLDRDEFDLRVGRALASRTYADLAALTADIPPARPTRARPQEPVKESANKEKNAVPALACATVATVGMLAAVPPMMPDGWPFAVPVLVLICVLFGAVSTGWLLLLHAWLDEGAGRKSAHGLPPGAAGEASRSPAPGDPAGELPQVDRDPWRVAEAAPIRRPRLALPSWRTPNRRRLQAGAEEQTTDFSPVFSLLMTLMDTGGDPLIKYPG